MLKLEQVSLKVGFKDRDVLNAISKHLNVGVKNIDSYKMLKLSIDARKKPNIKYVASIGVNLKNNLEAKFSKLLFEDKEYLLDYKLMTTDKKIVIVGFGPSGMFSALALAKMGLRPLKIGRASCRERV